MDRIVSRTSLSACWHENLKKRQVKAPKVYVRDSGLLHALLGLESYRDILAHPKCGASWEGFAIEEVLAALRPREACFWGVHGQAELDLFLLHEGSRWGIELKFNDAPRLTRSLQQAVELLDLERAWILYPGDRRYLVAPKVEVVPLAGFRSAI